MKIAKIFTVLTILLVCSCNPSTPKEGKMHSNPRDIAVNKYLTERFTEVELKGFTIKEIELSDREAYGELFDYYMSRADHNFKVGRDPNYFFRLADSITRNHTAKAEGNLLFHKVVVTKATPDTIHYSVFYFDNNDTLLKATHYK